MPTQGGVKRMCPFSPGVFRARTDPRRGSRMDTGVCSGPTVEHGRCKGTRGL